MRTLRKASARRPLGRWIVSDIVGRKSRKGEGEARILPLIESGRCRWPRPSAIGKNGIMRVQRLAPRTRRASPNKRPATASIYRETNDDLQHDRLRERNA